MRRFALTHITHLASCHPTTCRVPDKSDSQQNMLCILDHFGAALWHCVTWCYKNPKSQVSGRPHMIARNKNTTQIYTWSIKIECISTIQVTTRITRIIRITRINLFASTLSPSPRLQGLCRKLRINVSAAQQQALGLKAPVDELMTKKQEMNMFSDSSLLQLLRHCDVKDRGTWGNCKASQYVFRIF